MSRTRLTIALLLFASNPACGRTEGSAPTDDAGSSSGGTTSSGGIAGSSGGVEAGSEGGDADASPTDVPVEICDDAPTAAAPVKIGTAVAWHLAVAKGKVYWSSIGGGVYASDGEIGVISRCGTSSRVLLGNQTAPYGLAAALSTVCWVNLGSTVNGQYGGNGGVYCWGGSGAVTEMGKDPRPYQVATDGVSVFFTADGASEVYSASTKGGKLVELARFQRGDEVSIALDDENVYVTTYGDVASVPKKGGAKKSIVSGFGGVFRSAVASGDSLYLNGWRNATEGGIYRVSKNGGEPTLLAPALEFGNQIGVDEHHVYYVGDGALRRVPVDGGASELLSPDAGQYALAVDDTYVFWEYGGVIWRLRKF